METSVLLLDKTADIRRLIECGLWFSMFTIR